MSDVGSWTVTQRLADVLADTTPDRVPIRRQGIVTAISYSTSTVSVQLGGSGITIPNVRYLESYYPVVGDTVWVDILGSDVMIIGSVIAQPWTTYTPVWGGTGTPPTTGNATLAGAYMIVGRTMFFRIKLICGSTSNQGVGSVWSLGFPSGYTPKYDQACTGVVVKSGGGSGWSVSAECRQNNTAVFPMIANTVFVGTNNPTVWATGDYVSLTGAIEIN